MTEPATIICPHCDSSLKLKDRGKLGQKITCPKCKKPFKAEERIDAEEEFGSLDEMDSEAADEEESGSARRNAGRQSGGDKKKGKGKGKSRRKSSGNNLPLIIGGAVAVALLIGVGLFLIFRRGGDVPANPVAGPVPDAVAAPVAAPVVPVVPARKSIDFSWLPPQSDVVVYVRPSDLLKAPFVQWAIDTTGSRDQLNQSQEQLRKEMGAGLDDLESITIGIKSLGDLTAGAAGIASGGMPDPFQVFDGLSKLSEKEIVGVARFSKPVDLTKNPQFQQITEAVTHQSVTYYRDKSLNGKTPSSFTYFPTPTLAVISGREDVLKALIDRQGKAEPRPELDIIDPSLHLVIATLVKPEFADNLPDGPLGSSNPRVTYKKVQSGYVGIKATEGLELSITQLCPDTKTAEEVQSTTDLVFAQSLKEYRGNMSVMPKNLGQLGETLLASAKTSRRETIVDTVLTLPATSRDNLTAAPMEVISAMMTAGPKMHPPTAMKGQSKMEHRVTEIGPDGPRDSIESNRFRGAPVEGKKVDTLPGGTECRAFGGWSDDAALPPEGTPRMRLMT
ncbi:MAG: hypothetical protein JWM11_1203, partial [Planctomycetaceae bacterium]|nr:hypothetical protein [Planctomycetaceae bacterium]